MVKHSELNRYFLCFGAGIIAANLYFVLKTAAVFFFVGEPVVCQSSFPRYHNACVYSRFGFGEQAISLQIDDETVFFVSDFIPGNLNERITWDKSGRIVTFHVDGLGEQIYDAETKTRVR